jgi:hypothetical protein
MGLKSLRQINKTVKQFKDQVGTTTAVASATISATYVTSTYADTTFTKSS